MRAQRPSRSALMAAELAVVVTLLSGCGTGAFGLVGALIETGTYAATHDDANTYSSKEYEILGYCYDKSMGYAYPVRSNSYYGGAYGKCAPGDSSITKSEFDRISADQSRAYCAKKNDQLYRSTTNACQADDKRLIKDDWEALARNHSTPAVS